MVSQMNRKGPKRQHTLKYLGGSSYHHFKIKINKQKEEKKIERGTREKNKPIPENMCRSRRPF